MIRRNITAGMLLGLLATASGCSVDMQAAAANAATAVLAGAFGNIAAGLFNGIFPLI